MSGKLDRLDNRRLKYMGIVGNLWAIMFAILILRGWGEELGLGPEAKPVLTVLMHIFSGLTLLTMLFLLIVSFKILGNQTWFKAAYDERYYDTLRRACVLAFSLVMATQLIIFLLSTGFEWPAELSAAISFWVGLTAFFNALYFQNRERKND